MSGITMREFPGRRFISRISSGARADDPGFIAVGHVNLRLVDFNACVNHLFVRRKILFVSINIRLLHKPNDKSTLTISN